MKRKPEELPPERIWWKIVITLVICACVLWAGTIQVPITLAGDVTGSQNATVVGKINGTTVPVNSAANQVLVTTAAAVSAWETLPACTDSGGNHLNYNNSTQAFSCGTSGSATIIKATATIDFASIADGTCLANTFTLTGAVTGDSLAPDWPSTLETGLFGTMLVSAANTVQVRLCNLSGGAVDPASQTFGASVIR